MNDKYEQLKKHISSIPTAIPIGLERSISKKLDKCGLFYRIFSRCKSPFSTIEKLKLKKDEYEKNGKKMQDLIGVRIALYFKDDIDICVEIIKNNYTVLDIVRDKESTDLFSPIRLNIVCKMPIETYNNFSEDIWHYPIDNTFEIQIRTVFSEGWHEIEHDFRYKRKSDWDDLDGSSRNLNGIFATLETCDWAIISLLDQMAYQKYHANKWEAMIRNHFRIRLNNTPLRDDIVSLFDENHAMAKDFLKVDRMKLLLYLSNPDFNSFTLDINNLIFLTNELIIKDSKLSSITPIMIIDKCSNVSNLPKAKQCSKA